jgi:hypothetical protein
MNVDAIYQLEGFWYGAALARNELYTGVQKLHTMDEAMFHHTAVHNLETLAVLARAGCDITATSEFKFWMEWKLVKELKDAWSDDYYSRKRDL